MAYIGLNTFPHYILERWKNIQEFLARITPIRIENAMRRGGTQEICQQLLRNVERLLSLMNILNLLVFLQVIDVELVICTLIMRKDMLRLKI